MDEKERSREMHEFYLFLCAGADWSPEDEWESGNVAAYGKICDEFMRRFM